MILYAHQINKRKKGRHKMKSLASTRVVEAGQQVKLIRKVLEIKRLTDVDKIYLIQSFLLNHTSVGEIQKIIEISNNLGKDGSK